MNKITPKKNGIHPLVSAIRKTIMRPLDPNDPMYYMKGLALSDPLILAEFRQKVIAGRA